MSHAITVWGIPTCGTVKKAHAWLDAKGLAYRKVDLRTTPPSKERVARWVLGFGVQALKNTSGGAYRALPADKDRWSEEEWLAAFVADPMLIRRPVIEAEDEPLAVGWRSPPAL
jgi:arsenate reductase